MIAAHLPVQRPADAKILIVDSRGRLRRSPRAAFVDFLCYGDLVIANDAGTFPAALHGQHARTGEPIEVRLAGRRSLASDDLRHFSAIVFGAGDFHTRTEHRPAPSPLSPGDVISLGPLEATIEALLDHARLVTLRFHGSDDAIRAGLARHGRPIQYAHVDTPLMLSNVWTPIAGAPVAFESPSAGFALDWGQLAEMRARGVGFATITHAAGISSTGDDALDANLPFDEPYRISQATACALARTRACGGRVIAIGTTVVRALEHAGDGGRVRAGEGVATQRIGPATRLRIVDAILSGTHEPGTSHYELLRAFTDEETLKSADLMLESGHFLTHEFGDSVLIEKRIGVLGCALWQAAVACASG